MDKRDQPQKKSTILSLMPTKTSAALVVLIVIEIVSLAQRGFDWLTLAALLLALAAVMFDVAERIRKP